MEETYSYHYGTDEESDWKCTERYFQTEENAYIRFAPDAEFPAIHGEKGITTFDLVQNSTSKTKMNQIMN